MEGSKERSDIVSNLVEQMEKDPVLKVDASYYNLTKEEQREDTAKKIDRISRYFENEFPDQQAQRLSILGVFDPQVFTRIGVNLGLFVSCIRGSGTNSQFFYWTINKGVDKLRGIYGCFGMTELAHGSNVQGIETTATFDKETDEFVINTPHIGATKWWIGGAAHSATHCTVYARLKVNGKDYGVKTFVVPLRDSITILCQVSLLVILVPRWVEMVLIMVGFNSPMSESQDSTCCKNMLKFLVKVKSLCLHPSN